MTKSKWHSIEVCVECKTQLSKTTRLYNNALCPHCGHKSKGTICDTETIIFQQTRHTFGWKFWKRKFTYVAKDQKSLLWLKNMSLNVSETL